MNPYLSDAEKVVLLKKWLNQYGSLILSTLFVVIAIYLGWQWWSQRQVHQAQQASQLYEEMMASAETQDNPSLSARAHDLMANYPKTFYGQVAGLFLAKQAVISQKWSEAEQHLQWVRNVAADSSLRQLAGIRLARVWIAENKLSDALALLQKNEQAGFAAYNLQIEGDIYLKLGQIDKARHVYSLSLAMLPKMNPNYALLKMKLAELSIDV